MNVADLWYFDYNRGLIVRAADGARFRPEDCPGNTDEAITAWVAKQPLQEQQSHER